MEERGDGEDKRCGGSTAARFLSHIDNLSPFWSTGGLEKGVKEHPSKLTTDSNARPLPHLFSHRL